MIERSDYGSTNGYQPEVPAGDLDGGLVDLMVEIEGEGDGFDVEESAPEPPHYANLAEHLSESELVRIGQNLVTLLDSDKQSRSGWEKTYKEGLDHIGLRFEERNKPWPGACGVFHPIMAEAVIRFQSQAIVEMFPAAGPAKAKIIGKADDARRAQAIRLQEEFNYWLIEKMPEYRQETEKLLFALPMAGAAFRKLYVDPVLKRPTAVFVPAEDFIIPYGYSRLEVCPRYTHILRRDANDIRKLQASGFYRDVTLTDSILQKSEIEEKKSELTGNEAPSDASASSLRVLYEMHVDVDLPAPFADVSVVDGWIENTGIALPYVVTIDEESGKVLSIYRNWEEGDQEKRKRLHFAEYSFIPGMESYGFGLVHLLGGVAKASTSILRQLVDAGTLSNLPAGYKSRDLRVAGDNEPLIPGEWRDADVAGGTLREAFFPAPYKEPSLVLFQLLQNLVAEGRRFASTADMQVGDMNQEAPVGTTVALLERAMKVMTAIQARLHASQLQEFRLLKPLIRYARQQYEYDPAIGDRGAKAADFDDRVDVVPVSDPNSGSMSMRVTQYQAALQLSAQSPGMYDLPKLHRQMLEAIGIQGVMELIPEKGAGKLADPLAENISMLTNKPARVFPHQDHDAHMEVHLALLNDPKTIQVFNQSALGSQMKAAIDAHIAEHLAFAYRDKVERQIGTPIPLPGEPMDPQTERMVSTLMAEGSRKALAQSKAAAEAQQAAAPAADPVVQLQQAEIQFKAQKAQSDAATAAAKLQLQKQNQDNRVAIDQERIRSQERISAASLQSREEIAEADREAEFAMEAMKPAPVAPQNRPGGKP